MRTKKSLINISVGLFGHFFSLILNFVSRTVFIYVLGSEFLGISGLFTNVLSILSLAELGISGAITYNMYAPLAKNDEKKVSSLMNLYKRLYIKVGFLIFAIGTLIIPLLPFIIKDMPDISNINLIYILFLLDSSVSYFFAYKQSLLIADQKQYITIITNQKVNFVKILSQILILILTKNYILYLMIGILFTLLNNVYLSYIVDSKYKYLKKYKEEKLSKEEIQSIFKYISGLFMHKVGGVMVFNTDNLLISAFVGLKYVGLTSNYYMITNMVNSLVVQVYTAITASVGSLIVENNIEKSYSYYKVLNFLSFVLFAYTCNTMLFFFNPFIEMWIGKEYLLSFNLVLLIVINVFLTGMRRTNWIYTETMGLMWHGRFKPIIEAGVNLLSSIVLLKIIGIAGVFLGTLISTVVVCIFYEPYIVFKHGFKKSLSMYFSVFLKYILVFTCIVFSTYFIIGFIELPIFTKLISILVISFTVTSIYIFIFFRGSNEFLFVKNRFLLPIVSKIKSSFN